MAPHWFVCFSYSMLPLNQRNWRVCGIILEKTFSVTEKRMKLIEHEFDELFESSKSGYTCGLWMLFHYLTVASQHVTSSKSEHTALTTHDIMSFIRMTVEKLFNCRTCRYLSYISLFLYFNREHFLHMYDKCLYGRCEISDYDYNKLQVFFFLVL